MLLFTIYVYTIPLTHTKSGQKIIQKIYIFEFGACHCHTNIYWISAFSRQYLLHNVVILKWSELENRIAMLVIAFPKAVLELNAIMKHSIRLIPVDCLRGALLTSIVIRLLFVKEGDLTMHLVLRLKSVQNNLCNKM